MSYGGIRKSLRQDIILKTVKYNKKRIQGKTQCEEGSSIITTESDSLGAGKNVEVEGKIYQLCDTAEVVVASMCE